MFGASAESIPDTLLETTSQNHFVSQGVGKGGKILEGSRGEKSFRACVTQNEWFRSSQATIDGAHLVDGGLSIRSHEGVAEFCENPVRCAFMKVNVGSVQVRE